MNKIKLNLFDLKAKEDLVSIRDIFSKSIKRWFKDDSTPKDEFFTLDLVLSAQQMKAMKFSR